jgi:hypothetical protein
MTSIYTKNYLWKKKTPKPFRVCHHVGNFCQWRKAQRRRRNYRLMQGLPQLGQTYGRQESASIVRRFDRESTCLAINNPLFHSYLETRRATDSGHLENGSATIRRYNAETRNPRLWGTLCLRSGFVPSVCRIFTWIHLHRCPLPSLY